MTAFVNPNHTDPLLGTVSEAGIRIFFYFG